MRILKNGTFEDLYRIADVRFTPDELAAMRGEGIHMVSDPDVAETDVMKGVDNRKRDIRALVGRIALPRIMYPSADHVVEMNGRQYYVIHVAPPQPKKNPEGTCSTSRPGIRRGSRSCGSPTGCAPWAATATAGASMS
jgi:hypothetical protein